MKHPLLSIIFADWSQENTNHAGFRGCVTRKKKINSNELKQK